MPNRILRREELARKLSDWEAGRTSSEELHRWAEGLYPSNVDYEDWEGGDSVTNVVLGALDMLDMNLVLPEDAQIYLEFLSTPPGQFQEGYKKYERALDQIDLAARRVKLRNIPLYAPYLGNR